MTQSHFINLIGLVTRYQYGCHLMYFGTIISDVCLHDTEIWMRCRFNYAIHIYNLFGFSQIWTKIHCLVSVYFSADHSPVQTNFKHFHHPCFGSTI